MYHVNLPDPCASGQGAAGAAPSGRAPSDSLLANFGFEELPSGNPAKPKLAKVGLPLRTIGENLLRLTGGWPKLAGGLLFVEGQDYQPLFLPDQDALFAWANQRLSTSGAANAVRWAEGEDKVPRSQFFAGLEQMVERYDSVQALPHFPSMAGAYYMHRPPGGGDGTAFRGLVQRFTPASLIDYDLIECAFMTPFWGGRPGRRPAFLVTAEDGDEQAGRGVGKTTLAELVGRLAGGIIEARPNDTSVEKIVTRLLSRQALTKRVALLDNLKTLKFSDADLEQLLTAATISGHRMYSGEGQRPNDLVWFFTINGASLSRDMAQRSVIVKVKRPSYSKTWRQDVEDYIDAHRWDIIGDIIARLRQDGPPLARSSRWADWEGGVLSRVAEPNDAWQVLEDRRQDVDDDTSEADLVRDTFAEQLRRRGHISQADIVFIPNKDAAEFLVLATGEKRGTIKAVSYLNTLAIPELRRSKKDGRKGWCWRGEQAAVGRAMVPLRPAPYGGGTDFY
jgi:hypothetical protein